MPSQPTLIDTVTRNLARVMSLVGILIVLVGVYAAGGVHTTCRRADGRVECQMRTLRIFELCDVGSQDAHDVVTAYDVTVTTSSGAYPGVAGPDRNATRSDTVVLESRDGTKVSAFNDTPDAAMQKVGYLRTFLGDPNRKTLRLFSSNWPFGFGAMGFGVVWGLGMGYFAKLTREAS
jgi:hypothetical protein